MSHARSGRAWEFLEAAAATSLLLWKSDFQHPDLLLLGFEADRVTELSDIPVTAVLPLEEWFPFYNFYFS